MVTDYLTMVMSMVGWVNSEENMSSNLLIALMNFYLVYCIVCQWKINMNDVKQVEGGVLMGIQLIFSEKLSLDLFTGGGLHSEFDHKPIDLDSF